MVFHNYWLLDKVHISWEGHKNLKKSPNFLWRYSVVSRKSWQFCSHFCGHLKISELYRKNVKINYFLSTDYSAMVVDSAMTTYVISPPKTKGCLACMGCLGWLRLAHFGERRTNGKKCLFFFFMTSHGLSNSEEQRWCDQVADNATVSVMAVPVVKFQGLNCKIRFLTEGGTYRIVASTNTCYYSENQIFYSLE